MHEQWELGYQHKTLVTTAYTCSLKLHFHYSITDGERGDSVSESGRLAFITLYFHLSVVPRRGVVGRRVGSGRREMGRGERVEGGAMNVKRLTTVSFEP